MTDWFYKKSALFCLKHNHLHEKRLGGLKPPSLTLNYLFISTLGYSVKD